MKLKEQSPEKTVNTIRNILYENGIFTTEQWIKNVALPDSMRITVHDLPVGTDGKGVDCKYAAASGFAEFMERLQNLILLYKADFVGNQDVDNLLYSDKIIFSYDHFRKNHLDILKSLVTFGDISELDHIFEQNNIPLETVPFLHLNTNETDYLPRILMDLSIGSNGMCAGNSPHEALIQGLCEIFERHVLKEIHKDATLALPVVSDSYLKTTNQWNCIQYIRSKGYALYVKDCSLGGLFPVVGVLLVKEYEDGVSKALFNLGSCPNFSVALERCLTEIMQGIDFNSIDSIMKPVGSMDTHVSDKIFSTTEKQVCYQYFNNLFTGQGVVPAVVLDHTGAFNEKHLFDKNDILSEAALADLVILVKKAGHDLYCRDVSFLGFPSYQIYIPGMSEVMRLDVDHIQHIVFSLAKAKTIFFNIDSAQKSDVHFLIETIEYINDEPLFQKEKVLSTIYGLSFREKVSLDDIAPEIVVSVLHYKLGEYKLAHEKLHAYLCKTVGEENLTEPPSWAADQVCLLTFFLFMRNGQSLDWVLEHLKNETPIPLNILESTYQMLSNENRLSEYLDIPKCEDCEECSYRGICCFVSWRKVRDSIQLVIDETGYDSIENLRSALTGMRQLVWP